MSTRDAAAQRGDVALERRAGAERDDRRAVLGADAHDRARPRRRRAGRRRGRARAGAWNDSSVPCWRRTSSPGEDAVGRERRGERVAQRRDVGAGEAAGLGRRAHGRECVTSDGGGRRCSTTRAGRRRRRRTTARSRRAGRRGPSAPARRTSRPSPAGSVAGISGVHTGPGATALTRMPRSDERLGERVGERDDRALGRRVVDQGLVAAQPVDRARC